MSRPEPRTRTEDPGRSRFTERLRRLPGIDARLFSGNGGFPLDWGLNAPRGLVVGKYRLGPRLGAGGMGEVVRAYDRELERTVALKRLRAPRADSPEEVERFLEEARTAARLEHPNIVPVYDTGRGPEGRPFFTMKWVRGRTLADLLRGLASGHRRLKTEFPLSRRVQVLQSVCMAVSFAHQRGVVHRDLKPANVLLGTFGEVHVVDWGLARTFEDGRPGVGRKPASRRGRRAVTEVGLVQGTPSYMAPEQARGLRAGRHTDVYGLGSILYEILTLRPPYRGARAWDVVKQVRGGPPPRPGAVDPSVPPALEAICLRAMHRDTRRRFPSARALHEALVEYLEGSRERTRRRQAADRAVAVGLEELREHRALCRRLKAAGARAETESRRPRRRPPAVEKAALLRQRRELEDLEGRSHSALGRTLEELSLALRFDPDHPGARRELAALHGELLLEAEEEGRARDTVLHRRMLEAVNDGSFDRFLVGDGALSLETDPPGASVRIHRYLEAGFTLRPGPGRALGRTPFRDVQLPMGSYLAVLEKEGFEPTRFPFLLRRNERRTARFPLLRRDQIGEGFLYVPPGPFVMGGDPRTLGAASRREVDVPGFLVARLPVTFAEYLSELNQPAPSGGPGVPRDRYAPRAPGETGEYFRRVRGRFALRRDRREWTVHPRWPVFGVSWRDAQAYLRARSEREGIRYRLLRDEEWEKAARGADGRLFPWGNRFHPSLCKMAESRPGRAQPEPVGRFRADLSPYGVRDMAGGVQEWVADWLNRKNGFRMVRGGAYSNREPPTHCAYRSGAHEMGVYNFVGFRVARGMP